MFLFSTIEFPTSGQIAWSEWRTNEADMQFHVSSTSGRLATLRAIEMPKPAVKSDFKIYDFQSQCQHLAQWWHSWDFNAEYKGYLAATQRVCISFTCVSFTPTLLITLEYSLKVNIILLDAFEESLVKRESNKLNVNICRRVRALNHVVTNSRVAAVQYYFILFLWQDDDKRHCGSFAQLQPYFVAHFRHSSSASCEKQLQFYTESHCLRRSGRELRKYYDESISPAYHL